MAAPQGPVPDVTAPNPTTDAPASPADDAAIALDAVTVRIGGTTTLGPVSLTLPAGRLTAIAGGSGAGKTTLLDVMAGVRRPSGGSTHVGADRTAAHALAGTGRVGVVPQDDIIHRELPLRRTLLHAARLRLARPRPELEARVDDILARLDLARRGGVRVGALSGGQRKRASIAVELLTDPEVLFLDEPTSGLDPVSAAEVVSTLRHLAAQGVTVVMTTHDPAQLDAADVVVFLAPGGRLAFAGPPVEARRYFHVTDLAAVYPLLADPSAAAGWTARWAGAARPVGSTAPTPPSRPLAPSRPRPNALRQWAVLTRRSAEVVAHNRLTLAVLLGSPALVIAMMTVLFQPDAFGPPSDGSGTSTIGPAQTVFWIAFAGFFFGLTYGLLQIVGERAILRRERFGGLDPAAYVASKVALLLPVLAAVDVALLVVLRLLGRLPEADGATYAALAAALLLESLAALLLGLATSAAVADAAQATLALPMLCFPQVLFAGAVVPVAQMALPGRAISYGMATRWTFESLGRSLEVNHLTGPGPHAAAFSGPAASGWAVLAALAMAGALAAWAVVRRRPGS